MEISVNNLVLNFIYYGILVAFLVGVPVIVIINCVKIFKNTEYNRIDKISSVFNILTITFYIPMSLFSVMQLIAHFNIQTKMQEILWYIWCVIGMAIPIISIISIVFPLILENKENLG